MPERTSSETSHNNPAWVGEVNRIAPLLGFDGIRAEPSKLVRKGKTVKRVCTGDVPSAAVSTFPGSYRRHLKDLAYYWTPERYAHVPPLEI